MGIVLCLEGKAEGEEYLMALVGNAGGGDVALDFGRLEEVGLHGIELTVGGAVLIGQVEVHRANLTADAAGETVGAVPVDIVGGGSIFHAIGVERHVAHTVLVVGRRDIVVAGTESHLWNGLILEAHLQCRHALQNILRIAFHDGVLIGILFAISVVAILHAILAGTVIRELVGGTDGQRFANGMTQAETELPRCILTELVGILDIAHLCIGAIEILAQSTLVDEGCGILRGQIIPSGGIDIQTYAER